MIIFWTNYFNNNYKHEVHFTNNYKHEVQGRNDVQRERGVREELVIFLCGNVGDGRLGLSLNSNLI